LPFGPAPATPTRDTGRRHRSLIGATNSLTTGGRSAVSNDNDRIGLSRSTPEGQEVRLAAGLSGQTGWRRTAAKTFALLWLAAMLAGIVIAAVNVLA
jgi:hypothetical protein